MSLHAHRPPPDAPRHPVRPLCPRYVLSLTHIVPLPMHHVIQFVLFVRGAFSHSHTSSPFRCTTSSSSSSLSAVRSLTHTHRLPSDAPRHPVRPLCPRYVLSLTHIVPFRCTTSSSSSSLSAVRSLTHSPNIIRLHVFRATSFLTQPFLQ